MTSLAARLRQGDMLQLMLAFFTILLFVLLVTWPNNGQASFNGWYALEQTKVAALVFVSIAFGSYAHRRSRRDSLMTLLALQCFHILSLPLEMTAYALSRPAVPFWWPLLNMTLAIFGFFTVGVLMGYLFKRLRLSLLLPMVAPLTLVSLIAIDVRLGFSLVNPMLVVAVVSYQHLIFVGILSALGLWYLLRRDRHENRIQSA